MKQGWQIKKLGDLATYVNGFAFKPSDWSNTGLPIIRIQNLNSEKDDYHYYSGDILPRYRVKKGDVLISWSASLGVYVWKGNDAWLNQHIFKVVFDKDEINAKFFVYIVEALLSEMKKLVHGATMQHITKGKFDNIDVPVPPLSEQQRIVSLLDAEFAKIDALKTNAEKNLQNAKDLFQAALKKELEPKKGWFVSTLQQMLKLTSGDNLTAKSIVEGVYPVYGGNGIMGYHNQYNLDGENVIVGRVGALCGNVRFVKGKIWYTDNAFLVNDKTKSFYLPFLTYELTKANLRQYATQAAQPVISNVSMKDVVLSIPPTINDQQNIVARLDALSEKCETLQANYEKTLNLCDDLKQALLRKAFNGEI